MHGGKALVDSEDAWRVADFRWRESWHPKRTVVYVRMRTFPYTPLHQFILGNRPGMVIDHIDGDGLNNQRSNLRWATTAQNLSAQRRSDVRNKSGFKGVSFCRQTKKWRANITCKQKQITIGRYGTREDAARAYNEMAAKLFGEFGKNNAYTHSCHRIEP